MKSQNSPQSIWTIVLSIVITAVIVGGGFYFLQSKNAITKTEPATDAPYATSALCTDAPTEHGIGRAIYPIDSKYGGLGFLGQLFTAYPCGPARMNSIFGVDGNNYTLGSAVWLKSNPSQSLISTFKSIGFTCSEKVSDASCKKWELWDSVKVDELMKLEPHSVNFKADDCRNCG